MLRPKLWQLALPVLVIAGSLTLYFLHNPAGAPLIRAPKIFGHEENKPLPEPDGKSEFYEWRTTTSFSPISESDAAAATIEDYCRHFPKHKLLDVQPVLKTGHGVIERAQQSLRSTSACLDNLLIFSDLDEELEGYQVIDVIADIPSRLRMEDAAINQTLPHRQIIAAAASGKLNSDEAADIHGWEIDKFKFLPAVSRAWRMAPEKRWYVFYEGDTYIVWDTVFRLLENFDPDKPHYLGSPSPGREKTWFGNGGPGYILSREAVWQLVKDDWDSNTGEWLGSKLAERYWGNILTDCCGDSVLGWALHEHNIDVKGLWPLFNPHPFNGVPFSDLYWCQPVLSVHKPFYQESIDFWKFEWDWRRKNPTRPILYRDVAISFYNISSFTEPRKDWDNAEWDQYDPAPDDPYDPHNSADTCEHACEKAIGCFQWTFHKRHCRFVRSIRAGKSKDPEPENEDDDTNWTLDDRSFTAGWDQTLIRNWMNDRPCDQVQWVRPSVSRIF